MSALPLFKLSIIHCPSIASDVIGRLSYIPQLLKLTLQPPLRNLTFRLTRLRSRAFGHTSSAIKDLYPQLPALHTISVVFDIQEQGTEDKFLATLVGSSFEGIDTCLSACGALRRMQWMRAIPSASVVPVELTFPQFTSAVEARFPRLKAARMLHRVGLIWVWLNR
jgi:hypothetical protein